MRARLFPVLVFLLVAWVWAPSSFAGQTPQGAIHLGELDGQAIRWSSSYEIESCPDDARPCRIELAIPMSPGYRVLALDGVRPIENDGQITALELTEPRAWWGRVGWTVVQADGLERITPPLAKREGWQIVDVHGPGDARFEPAPDSGLERRVGYFARPALAPGEREQWSHRLGYERRRLSDAPMFVRDTSGWERGIPGSITTRAQRSRGAKAAAAIAFAAVMAVLLFLLARRSASSAEGGSHAPSA